VKKAEIFAHFTSAEYKWVRKVVKEAAVWDEC